MNTVATFCPQCGASSPRDDRFCRGCGTALAAPEELSAPIPTPVGEAWTPPPPPRARSARTPVVVALALVVAVAAAVGGFALTHHDSSSAAEVSNAPVYSPPTTMYAPPTTSLQQAASNKNVAAFNRRQAALRAIVTPGADATQSAFAVWVDRQARVWEQYRADVLAITYPIEAKADADQLVRDVTSLIDALHAQIAAETHENFVAQREAHTKVDGDDRVLANDLGNNISAPGDPSAS